MARTWRKKVNESQGPFDIQNSTSLNYGYRDFHTSLVNTNIIVDSESEVFLPDMLNCYRKANPSTDSTYCVPDFSTSSCSSCSDIVDPPNSNCTASDASCVNNFKNSPVTGATKNLVAS